MLEKSLLIYLCAYSGIFGYISYLVEKDRKYILDTLVNGYTANTSTMLSCLLTVVKVSPDWSIGATILQVWL